MRIQNNIAAENSHRQLGITNRNIGVNAERLSSGLRVNRAADDAAGLAISEKMRTQIRGLNRASMNIQDGVSLLQVGDSALQAIHDKMQRMRELSVQAANDTNQLLDREAIQLEFGQLTSEMNDVVKMTNFNGRLLFDGSVGASYEYSLGSIITPYITNIPAAQIFNPTESPTGVDVPGWTRPAGFGVAVMPAGLNSAIFPDEGLFAMQIVTPANGTLNVFLDFGVTNRVNGVDIAPGDMTLNNILAYFTQEFNDMGLGPVVDNIRYTAANEIVFDFPMNGSTLTGVMGRQPNPPIPAPPIPQTIMPRVTVGLGFGTGGTTGTGADAQRNSLNGNTTNWTSQPVISNRPDLHGNINSSTNFVNTAFWGPTAPTRPVGTTATAPGIPAGSGFPNVTINVNGNDTVIQLKAGNYPDAQSFIDANEEAFANAVPHGFEISLENGRLILTSKHNMPSPAISFSINPTTLASALGFPGNATGGITTERAPSGFLPIQSGANKGDMIKIEIPRLCTRSLGLSIRRPGDAVDPADGGPNHINNLGADGYRPEGKANVEGNPMEYSLDVTSHEKASAALGVLTNAINIISMERARMGAQQNRLEYSMKNVDNTAENLQAAESRIRDTDMAAEMTIFVKNQILQQSGTAMLAQANQLPQGMLQLLG